MLFHRFNIRSLLSVSALFLILTGCQEALLESDPSPNAPGPNSRVAQLTNRLSGDIRSLGKNLNALRRGLANQEGRIEGVRKELQALIDLLEKNRIASGAASKKIGIQWKELRGRLEAMDNEMSFLRSSGARGGSAPERDEPVQEIRPAGTPAEKASPAAPPKKIVPAGGMAGAGVPSQGVLSAGVPSGVPAGVSLPAGVFANAGQPKAPALPASETEFNEALRVFRKERTFPKARMLFNRFILKNPTHELADDAQYWIGESYYQEKNFERAILSFNKVQVDYANGDKAPDALLKEALAFMNLGDKASARELLGRVVQKYPNSGAAANAAKRLKSL
jgi:tol-pal system protein YbgF